VSAGSAPQRSIMGSGPSVVSGNNWRRLSVIKDARRKEVPVAKDVSLVLLMKVGPRALACTRTDGPMGTHAHPRPAYPSQTFGDSTVLRSSSSHSFSLCALPRTITLPLVSQLFHYGRARP